MRIHALHFFLCITFKFNFSWFLSDYISECFLSTSVSYPLVYTVAILITKDKSLGTQTNPPASVDLINAYPSSNNQALVQVISSHCMLAMCALVWLGWLLVVSGSPYLNVTILLHL
jgi:hypothetical protein